MKSTLAVLALCLVADSLLQAQFKTDGVITGANTPKHTVFLTFDDGPGEPGPDGLTQMQKVAQYLYGPIAIPQAADSSNTGSSIVLKSIRATFATVTCHFAGQEKADLHSSLCAGYGDVPDSVARQLTQLGHDLINHSVNHIPLSTIQDPAKIVYEVGRAQAELDKVQDNSPRLFRAPGLSFDARVAGVLNADAYTGKLIGPIDADVGADFVVDGVTLGGDWDCYAKKVPVNTCGDLYVQAIRAATHGVVVMLHVRTEAMTGRDGDPYALNLAKYIVRHLGPKYDYLPLDAIPGVLGNTRAAVQHVSDEFGSTDGQGDVVAGAILGKGKPAGVCKARVGVIYCKTPDGNGKLAPSTPWLLIRDSSWITQHGSKFWLADVNGDGRADVIFPSSGTLSVAYNNGRNAFYDPVPYFSGPLPDPRFIRFGRLNRDLLADMVVWAPGQTEPQIYINNGVRFLNPALDLTDRAPALPRLQAQLATVRLIDLNKDGLDDLVILSGSQVQCAINTGGVLGDPQPCSTAGGQFANTQGSAQFSDTFATAHINGPVLIAGVPTGLTFAPVVQQPVRISDRYRYLCNECFTNSTDKNWKPDLKASQIVWGDFGGSGNDSPLLVRKTGLFLGLTQIVP